MKICILCFISVVFRIVQALSSASLHEYCNDPDRIGVIGGVHNRLVAEGGHITLTCCVPGTTNGHDHEQLVWLDPRGTELTNHFANPHSQSRHGAYSVPDFRSSNHLVSTLVIPKIRADEAGEYTCRKANENSTLEAAVITLDLRPRLLADYMPLAPTSVKESEAAVVAGRPVFVALEEGREGELECRINPNLTVDDVHLTWYFQGRQLIAPASAIVGSRFHQSYDNELPSSVVEPEQFMNEERPVEDNQMYGLPSGGRPLSVDPSELGILLLENGQVLQIRQVGDRHAGTYLCKAEALNPDWSFQPVRYGKPAEERGTIDSPVLIQLQAIRGIVFVPPRLVPGNPMEVATSSLQGPTFVREMMDYRSFVKRDDTPPFMSPAHRYYMRPRSKNVLDSSQQTYRSSIEKIRPVAHEGHDMLLECQARGKPSPKLLWYRGGTGANMLVASKAVTFDQRVKEAMQHVPLYEVQKQLGILIADGERLLPVFQGANDKSEESGQQAQRVTGTSLIDTNDTTTRTYHLGRYDLSVGVRTDDTGDPVITVSRLGVRKLRPSDATRYTCLALLNLEEYGGRGNYTDVGSVFPEIVLRPRFIRSGTHLQASGYPGDNATLTCEAYGGLLNSHGLRIRLLRGTGVPRLIRLLTGSRHRLYPSESIPYAPSRTDAKDDYSDAIVFKPGPSLEPYEIGSGRRLGDITDFPPIFGNGTIDVVSQVEDPRYNLTVSSDPRNPYMSTLKLHIYDLRPEDNAYYACEALSGPIWRAITPSAHETPGRLTVWFPPAHVQPQSSPSSSDETERSSGLDREDRGDSGLVYGLSHLPSRLVCRTMGQPTPTWTWTGPQMGPDELLGNADGSRGYEQIDYQDGEWSVSELIVPAGYWNVGVFGTYTCVASNRLGSATGHIRLKLATHPDQPALRACKVEAKLIELCVDPPKETGGLPLTHYELRIQTHPRGAFYGPFAYLPGRRLLRLPHLIPGYYYRFALSAVSAAGRGPNAYLQVTTNRLSTPVIKMFTAQDYIEPTAYNVHWKNVGGSTEIDEYKISVRPVEVDYSMGEVNGRPIGEWVEYSPVRPNCASEDQRREAEAICQYRVENLKPDTAYELELSGHNNMGFSEAQRIIFRTSSLSGDTGRMLNMPSYLQHTSSAPSRMKAQSMVHQVLLILSLIHVCSIS